MIGSRITAFKEMYRKSVSIADGRVSNVDDLLSACKGRNFKRALISDFNVLSGSLRPASDRQQNSLGSVQDTYD